MNVGLVGCGQWGSNIAKHLKSLKHEVYVVDSNQAVLNEACDKYMLTPSSVSEIVSICESVFIATTSGTHYELCRSYLQDDLNVYCTKPMAFASQQARELIELAKEKNLKLSPGYVYRESDGFKMMRGYLRSQDVKHICMKFLNPKPPRTDSDIIYNIGVHYLDMVGNALFGYSPDIKCSYKSNWGKINIQYETFAVDVLLANNSKVKDRHAVVVYRNGQMADKIDFDKNEKDILQASIKDFLRGKEKTYDDVVGIQLCEVCEESNKIGEVVCCD